jgi:hypothetical protein
VRTGNENDRDCRLCALGLKASPSATYPTRGRGRVRQNITKCLPSISFACTEVTRSTNVKRVCYSEPKRYMIIKLKETYYTIVR